MIGSPGCCIFGSVTPKLIWMCCGKPFGPGGWLASYGVAGTRFACQL